MHRTRISLEPTQHEHLGAEAHRLGIGLSALIRRLVDAHLGRPSDDENPLAAITGMAEGSGEPIGREHNRHLYGPSER